MRDFIDCKAASVTIAKGKLTWLDLPEDSPDPDISVEPGAKPGTATINIGVFGLTVASIPASIDANGQLAVDTSALPNIDLLKGAKDALDAWVRDLNAWLTFNKKRLKPAVIQNGGVTLTKEDIPAAPPPKGPDKPPVVPPVTPPTDQGGGQSGAGKDKGGGGGGWGCLGLFILLVLLFMGVVGAGVVVLNQPHPPNATPTPATGALVGLPTPNATRRPFGPPSGYVPPSIAPPAPSNAPRPTTYHGPTPPPSAAPPTSYHGPTPPPLRSYAPIASTYFSPSPPPGSGPLACTGPEILLIDRFYPDVVLGGNGQAPAFSTGSMSYCLIEIATYHWNDGKGAPAGGTISLKDLQGHVVGTWKAIGTPQQPGGPLVNWEAVLPPTPMVIISGTYTVEDSGAPTWSWSKASSGLGFFRVWVQAVARGG